MENKSVKISIHGKWFRVPAVEANGNIIAIKGK